MHLFDIINAPDAITVQTEEAWLPLGCAGEEKWKSGKVEVTTRVEAAEVQVSLYADGEAVKRIQLRWNRSIDSRGLLFLGDHWERGYGDLEWRALVPERVMPWYFMVQDGNRTHGVGVKTGTNSMAFWQADSKGISLWLDVRCGGAGVRLGSRVLEAAVIVARQGAEGETPFAATREFCKVMCAAPRIPKQPIYGGNNWYYAYGRSSQKILLEDAKLISSLAGSENRPYMVVDDGWQVCHNKSCNGGPWNAGNYLFPDMPRLAADMKEAGARPGIWIRPLLTSEKVPDSWRLDNARFKKDVLYQFTEDQFCDPSIPDVLDKVAEDIRCLVAWGYEMIKHDFTTCDIFGRWGFEMGGILTNDGWSFADNTRTSAEILLAMYRTIREAAGDVPVMGCNTISHLSAGIFEMQRTGDDVSGLEWERTRKMGVNTLAFRMPQHHTFYAADADCVGITERVPWELNRQWLELLAGSGTLLFVSVSPDKITPDQEKAIRTAFDTAAVNVAAGEPLDWMHTTCPEKWLLGGREKTFDWYDKKGVRYFE